MRRNARSELASDRQKLSTDTLRRVEIPRDVRVPRWPLSCNDVSAMSLPNDDDDDLVTKRDLRTEIGALRGELRAEVARIDQRFDRLDAKIDDQGHRHGVMLEQILATVQAIGERQSVNDDAQTREREAVRVDLTEKFDGLAGVVRAHSERLNAHDRGLAAHHEAIPGLARRRRR